MKTSFSIEKGTVKTNLKLRASFARIASFAEEVVRKDVTKLNIGSVVMASQLLSLSKARIIFEQRKERMQEMWILRLIPVSLSALRLV